MIPSLRPATLDDCVGIKDLIARSVRGLSQEDYTPRQIELSIRSVFGVDTDLINDGTYFVAEAGGNIVGCGGWSRRRTLYGASTYSHSRDEGLLDPATDAAKIRAFFIHPDHARHGIGSAILERCEAEAKAAGFERAEMMATLPGVRLYAKRGYAGNEQFAVHVGEGEEIICIRMIKNLV